MYRIPQQNESVSQGDIFDDCPLFALRDNDESVRLDSDPVRWLGRVAVMTQACDLATDKTLRVVVAVVHVARELVDGGVLKAEQIRDKIRRHQVFGWYFLPRNQDAQFPESVVDFRNLHTVSLAILNQLREGGSRRCRLDTPYREHLSQHFANTYARIGLPDPYDTEP